MFNTKKNQVLHIAALLLLIYFVAFVKLGSFHMRLWDESMFAVNVYEMLHNGKFFTPFFNGVPDLYNTKPPLTLWLQMASVKLLGYNELALRLPSAIAATLSILGLFWFIAKKYNVLWAWISAMVLLTSPGFFDFHTARTADSDALLTFFLVVASIFFIRAVTEERKNHILWFFIFILLASATKLYAAFLFAPACFIILIWQKKIGVWLKSWQFYLGFFLVVLASAGLILIRELNAPGYLNEIILKDAGRLFKPVENHHQPFAFYLDNLLLSRYSYWFLPAIVGMIISFFISKSKEQLLLRQLTLMTLCYLLIISLSQTKLEWYDMPLYPLLAVIAAYPVVIIMQYIISGEGRWIAFKRILFLVLIFVYPYTMMVRLSQENGMNDFEKMNEATERFLCKSNHKKMDLNGLKIYQYGYSGSLLFYKYKLAEMNQQIELLTEGNFNVNDRVLVSQDSLKTDLQKHYVFHQIDALDNAELLQIDSVIVIQ